MNNNTVKITVTDNRGDLVLATTSETYAADLQNNKDKLNVWWRCNVEYDNGKVGYDYPCNHNGKKPRKVIFVNGRLIYADYNFSIEGVENMFAIHSKKCLILTLKATNSRKNCLNKTRHIKIICK